MPQNRANPRQPLILDPALSDLPDAPEPAAAPPPDDMLDETQARPPHSHGHRLGLGGMFLGLGATLVMLWLGLGLQDLIADLFSRSQWLGWLGLGIVGTAVGILLILGVRELGALWRLNRLAELRSAADAVLLSPPSSSEQARRVVLGLERLYRSRRDLDGPRARLAQARADTPDHVDFLRTAEHVLIAPLDQRAESEVRRASRDVATATALMPLALLDVAAAFYTNVRMIRAIAEIYGGRAGWLGSWRLMKAVLAHLIATGAVAITDDMLGPLVGGSVLARLSRRFGEGAVNGALTARVGAAAIEICRPVPFVACPRPAPGRIVLDALRNWRKGT